MKIAIEALIRACSELPSHYITVSKHPSGPHVSMAYETDEWARASADVLGIELTDRELDGEHWLGGCVRLGSIEVWVFGPHRKVTP